jgi:hypothetical protein
MAGGGSGGASDVLSRRVVKVGAEGGVAAARGVARGGALGTPRARNGARWLHWSVGVE